MHTPQITLLPLVWLLSFSPNFLLCASLSPIAWIQFWRLCHLHPRGSVSTSEDKVNLLLVGVVWVRACISGYIKSGVIAMLCLNHDGFNIATFFFHLAEWHPLE